jgi:hypothetical protein
MAEIWENPFGYAILKIERAKKHIADFEERVRTSPDAYPTTVKIETKTGQHFLYYGPWDRSIRRDLALIAGDAIHNLRCALDIAYCEIIRTLSPQGFIPAKTKFFIGDDRKHYESTLEKTAKVARGSALFELLAGRIKPYRGGDSDICSLHDLAIRDKHHLLIPVANIVSIDGLELEDESGDVDVHTFTATRPLLTHGIAVPFGSHIKNHGKVAIRITFGNGILADDPEVVPTLSRLRWKTSRIVRVFQRMAYEARP